LGLKGKIKEKSPCKKKVSTRKAFATERMGLKRRRGGEKTIKTVQGGV